MKKLLLFTCALLISVLASAQKSAVEMPCRMSGLSAFLYIDLMELQKDDPSLSFIPDELKERYVFHQINSELYVGAFADIKADNRQRAAEYGVLFNGKEELPFMTVDIPLKRYVSFLNSGIADFIEVGENNYPMMDSARRVTHASQVNAGYQLPKGYCGKDVVIGIIDIGFDYTHRNFYDSTETRYRVKRVWDQNASGTPPSGYSYGNELTTQSSILNALYSHNDQTHGTHVAGMAAGGGSSESSMRKYKGMAPESDIVLVATTMSSNDIFDGLRYVLAYAQSVGKPCVVNMSLGSHVGPHDGFDINEINTDQLFENTYTKGAALMVSAGNEGSKPLHLGKTFTAQDSTLYTYVVKDNGSTAYSGIVDIWGTPGSNFRVKIAVVDSTTSSSQLRSVSFPLTINTNSSVVSMVTAVVSTGCTVRYATYTSYYYYNDKPRVYLNFVGSSNTGTNRCFLIKVESTSGTVHIWNNNGKLIGGAAATPGNTNYTSNNKASGNTSTMVASFDSKTSWTAYSGGGYYNPSAAVGYRSTFSSIGPGLNPNLNKPEIAAPGSEILSSYNKYDGSISNGSSNPYITHVQSTGGCWWGIMQGTSMACPATTGIVALWMEAYPELSWLQVKEVMRATATTDSYTGTIPANGSPYWGWGKIDANRGIRYILSRIPRKPVPSTSSSPSLCSGQSVTLTAPAGYSSYEWSNGANTRSITVSSSGSYKVRVDSLGYFSPWSDAVTVTVNPILSTTIAEGNQTICRGQSARLTVGTAGMGTSYSWNTGSTSQSITVTPTVTTIYTVTTSKLGYCPKTDTITVTVQPSVATTITHNPTICQGSSATLAVSGGSSHLWSTGDTTSSITVSPNVTTTYTVTSSESGKCSKTDTVTVTVQPYVTTTVTPNPTICQGSSATLTVSGGSLHLWSTGDTTSSITVSPTTTTTYTVTSSESGKCSKTDTVTVNVQLNVTTYTSGHPTICIGDQATLRVIGGTTHIWSTGDTTSSITVSPTTTTTYTVTSSESGYCSKTDTIKVTVQSYVSTTISNDTAVCAGSAVILTVNGGRSRTWSTGDTSASIMVTPYSSTIYYVTSNLTGYCPTVDSVTVAMIPFVATTIASDTAICLGESIGLAINGGVSRTWSTGDTASTIVVTPTATTVYTVISDSAGKCSATDTVTVTVKPFVTTIVSGNSDICQGQMAMLSVFGGSGRLWNTGSTQSTISVQPQVTTSYTVTTDSVGLCSKTDTLTVTVHPLPNVVITGDTLINAGETATLTASGAMNYLWSTGAVTRSIYVSPYTSTNYSVVGTDSFGCQGHAEAVVEVITNSIVTASELDFKVYPVPTETKLTVEAENISSITVYNILGKVVCKLDANGASVVEIPVGYYAQGTYVVSVENIAGQTGRKTFIVR